MDDPVSAPPPAASAAGSSLRPLPAPLSGTTVTAADPSRLDRLRGPLLTAAVVGGLTIALHVRDPHDAGSWGGCPWLALTGQYCPGCGGLRAVNDLTNGDLTGAASSNLLFLVMVPVVVLWWLSWVRRSWVAPAGREHAERSTWASEHPGTWIALFSVVMVTFAVLRNLPFGSWLAP